MVRPPCCEKMGVKKGPWTPEEDHILVTFVQRYGHENWRALPKQAGLLRCGKSCRLRWINYLRPDIKRGNFCKEEEEAIIELHKMMGNRWSTIATKLPGRTDNEIKNYWNTHLKKRVEQTPMVRKTWTHIATNDHNSDSDSEPNVDNVMKIQGENSHQNIDVDSEENNLKVTANSRLQLQSLNSSNISNDMFFWYNIFINAETT